MGEKCPKIQQLGGGGSENPNGSASWTRTSDHSINSRTLYQLSYRGTLSVCLRVEGEVHVPKLIWFANPLMQLPVNNYHKTQSVRVLAEVF